MKRAAPCGVARPQIPSRRITVCKVTQTHSHGHCVSRRSGHVSEARRSHGLAHVRRCWATAGLLGATCGADLDRPILGEPTLVARSLLLPASGVVDDIGKPYADRNIDFENIQGLIFLS